MTTSNSLLNKKIINPVMSLSNIKKTSSQKTILENLNLSIGHGEFITIVGPSGCGKTTILRLIAGLDSPDLGEIYLNNKNITMLPAEERPIHTIFQNYALFPHMNVFDNIAFGPRMKGVSEEIIQKNVFKTLKLVHLDGYQNKMPSSLSGGESQRVAIARAIINKPKLLLLDECLSALDYNLRRSMQNELKSMQRKLGIPFIFVTHDQEEALSLSDRIIVLRDGKIEQQGTPRNLYENPINIFVAKFIGDGNIFKAKVIKILSKYEILAIMEGKTFTLSCKDYLSFRKDKVITDLLNRDIYVLFRPEDLRITELDKNEQSSKLTGIILERNYKGMTLESVIKLDSGKVILSSEFFNEDDPDVDHQLSQKVEITWVNGWEVLLDE